MTQTPVRAPARRPVRFAAADIGGALTRGAVAGIVAGWAFLLANMWFAYSQGLPAGAPLAVIATVFYAAPAPTLTAASMLVGAVTHVGLSLGFGMGFAVLLLAVPALRRTPLLVLAGLGYGLALWILDFQILGRTVFPFFTNPMGPDQLFEGLIHPLIFGLGLVPFFLGWTPGSSKLTGFSSLTGSGARAVTARTPPGSGFCAKRVAAQRTAMVVGRRLPHGRRVLRHRAHLRLIHARQHQQQQLRGILLQPGCRQPHLPRTSRAGNRPSRRPAAVGRATPTSTCPSHRESRCVHPPGRPPENGGLPGAALRRRPSVIQAGIASGSAPALRHSCAAHWARGSSSSPSDVPSKMPATSASRSAPPSASSDRRVTFW
jgi:hypothetical protein